METLYTDIPQSWPPTKARLHINLANSIQNYSEIQALSFLLKHKCFVSSVTRKIISHLKGNYVLRWQWSEAPMPLHCWSRAKFFFHMPAWMKDIPGKMCILNWHSVNGWPWTWFLFVLRFWHDKNFCSQLFVKTVVDTQLLFFVVVFFFFSPVIPWSFREAVPKVKPSKSNHKKKEHFSHTSSQFLALNICLSTHTTI